MSKKQYPQFPREGLVLNPQKRHLNFRCCDCGLVHSVMFTVGHRQSLRIQMFRDNRKTAACRREMQRRYRKTREIYQ